MPAHRRLHDEEQGSSNGSGKATKGSPDAVERSSAAELVLAVVAFVGVGVGVYFIPTRWIQLAAGITWLVQVLRLHVQVWYFSGWPAFVHIVRRVPHAYVWTLVTLPIALLVKVAQWALAQLLFDDLGRLYRCETRTVTLVNWWRLAMDLNKPLRLGGLPYASAHLMINIISPTLVCSVHSFGPWSALDVQRMICSENHVVMRNDLLGTNFSYHHHTSGFVDNGVMYWVVAETAVLPPFTWLRRALWDGYARHVHRAIEEAEHRAKCHPARTYLGQRFWSDSDPPTLDSLFYPQLLSTERRYSAGRVSDAHRSRGMSTEGRQQEQQMHKQISSTGSLDRNRRSSDIL